MMDDPNLRNIYQNYKDTTSNAFLSKNRNQEWLDFLSQEGISNLPVRWSAVETPTGQSWGANVTFAGIMNKAKGIKEGSNSFEEVAPRMSSELQDFVIGLHEDKKVIDQNQASELIAMFQDIESLKYFIENYEKIKEVTETKEKDNSYDPLKYPFVKGNFNYDDESVRGGLQKLRTLYDEAVTKAISYTATMLSHTRDLVRDPETSSKVASAIEDPKLESILNFESDRYKEEWQRLENIYNAETQGGTKPMSKENRKNIEEILNLYIIDLSQKTAATLIKEKIEGKDYILIYPEGKTQNNQKETTNAIPKQNKKKGPEIYPELGM